MANSQTTNESDQEKNLRIKLLLYEFFFNAIVKIVLIGFGLFYFGYVLTYLIKAATPAEHWKFGIIDAMLAASIYQVYSHYFYNPTKKLPVRPRASSKTIPNGRD